MNNKLKQLLEQANAKVEDGTASDLGATPTGHIVNDEEDEALDKDE